MKITENEKNRELNNRYFRGMKYTENEIYRVFGFYCPK